MCVGGRHVAVNSYFHSTKWIAGVGTFACIVVNLPMVIVLPRPVIMFYMIFDPFQHKYNAFYRHGELFPIWATIIL